MSEDLTHRKGARKAEDIPAEVLGLLNRGEMETVNLTEWLAVDHQQLIQAAFPILGVSQEAIRLMSGEIASQKKPTAMNTTKLVGSMLYQQYPAQDELGRVLNALSTHPSDSIRCYAPYLIGLNDRLSIEDKLNQAQGLVADTHFGVREVVWMALRPAIDENLEESIRILSTWTSHEDENVRRFTTEATRPRGVWCKHIEELKSNPEMALPILEPLKADASKYVQDSVGNWLNDASKSKPEFVLHLCNRWKKESPTKETERIIKKARRTIDKK
ncbi:MAG TPA: DNA alkylation repair protein [Cytophagales bacterium]|nr:DNA alkylation repair protein [Cytophagales bacterium]HAP62135.1 DNA alkylation repair protein [Cytophagales bacterium]